MLDVDSVNHVGITVHNFSAVCERYEALGFTLTPFSTHKGSLKPGEPEVPFGTGNRCALFPTNQHLEILTWFDKDKYDFGVKHFLSRHEGAHIICFGSPDVAAVNRRVRQEGIDTSGVIPLRRDIETPEGMRTAEFDCVHFGKGLMPEGLIQVAHHRTPQYVYQERYIAHKNRVIALSDTYVSSNDPDEVLRRYERLTGRQAERRGARRVFKLSALSKLSILHSADLAAELPGSTFPESPCIAGFAFKTVALHVVTDILRANGLRFHGEPSRIVVPADAMFGATVVFEQVT